MPVNMVQRVNLVWLRIYTAYAHASMKHTHLVGTVSGCVVETVADLEAKMQSVALACGFTVRKRVFVQFEPAGATGVLVLAESHFAAHTFPEERCVRLDVYCCSDAFSPTACASEIENVFGATTCSWQVVDRP